MSAEIVLAAIDLAKTFHLGFLRKRVDAIKEVSFSVERGEIFGFLGPNGAGKTTTLKMLMGLIFPTRGRAEVFGRKVPDIEAKRRMGYLPETPYFYDYLTAEEFLDFAGELSGVPGPLRRKRRDELIHRVGLDHARGRALRKFSKGMLQRVGIAQAVMGDPELVVLDEPMTGLDPIGRKDIRDLMLQWRGQGKTVLYSTHILHDVEMTCDRVGIVIEGRLRRVGPLAKLLSPRVLATAVVVEARAGRLPDLPPGTPRHEVDDRTEIELPADVDVDQFLGRVVAAGCHVVSVQPRRESLEDVFVREAGTLGPAGPNESAPSNRPAGPDGGIGP